MQAFLSKVFPRNLFSRLDCSQLVRLRNPGSMKMKPLGKSWVVRFEYLDSNCSNCGVISKNFYLPHPSKTCSSKTTTMKLLHYAACPHSTFHISLMEYFELVFFKFEIVFHASCSKVFFSTSAG